MSRDSHRLDKLKMSRGFDCAKEELHGGSHACAVRTKESESFTRTCKSREPDRIQCRTLSNLKQVRCEIDGMPNEMAEILSAGLVRDGAAGADNPMGECGSVVVRIL